MSHNSLTAKVFVYTFALLVLIFTTTFFTIYYFLPISYVEYVEDTADQETELVYSLIEDKQYEAVVDEINKIMDEGIVEINIYNQEKDLIFPINLELVEDDLKGLNTTYIGGFTSDIEYYFTELYPISFGDENYYLGGSAILTSVSGVLTSLFKIIPITLLIILIVSIIIAIFYSKFLVKPILLLHKKSKEIAKLNFNNNITVKRNDEIGELFYLLDEMSFQLEDAMFHLEEDIKFAAHREEERRHYMATMSHDLKTPLTILKGLIECMQNNIGIYQDHDKYLGESLVIVGEVENLLLQFLESSEMDNFDYTLKLETINLADEINKAINKFEILIAEKSIKVYNRVGSTNLQMDISLMNKIFNNLIENAIKYTPLGGTIEFYIDTEGIFCIKNSYVDTSKLDPSKLFLPFNRAEESRNSKTGGHGLGLYIVRKAADIHKYKVLMELEPNAVIVKLKEL